MFGRELAHRGARVAQRHLDPVQQLRLARLALDLDLAELQRDPPAVRHAHRVVDHLDRDPVVAVAELVRLADRVQRDHRGQRGAAGCRR